MATTGPGETNARPPVDAASSPGSAVRPTARVRPLLPVRTESIDAGFSPDDPYVRRFWVAAIGAGAVAELLRLIRLGLDERCAPLPAWLPILIRSELVRVEGDRLVVPSRLPAVPRHLSRRFPPGLQDQHRRALTTTRPG